MVLLRNGVDKRWGEWRSNSPCKSVSEDALPTPPSSPLPLHLPRSDRSSSRLPPVSHSNTAPSPPRDAARASPSIGRFKFIFISSGAFPLRGVLFKSKPIKPAFIKKKRSPFVYASSLACRFLEGPEVYQRPSGRNLSLHRHANKVKKQQKISFQSGRLI